MILKMLKARNGDCLVLIFQDKDGQKHNVIIDGGPSSSFNGELKKTLVELNEEGIDLMILTHSDDDHIGGLIKFFEKNQDVEINIKRVLYNSPEILAKFFGSSHNINNELDMFQEDRNHSFNQANSLEYLLKEREILNTGLIHLDNDSLKIGEAKLYFLSPSIKELEVLNTKWTREIYNDRNHAGKKNDYTSSIEDLQKNEEIIESTVTNDSSIAFLFVHNEKHILLLGDANPNIVVCALKKLGYNKNNRLEVDLMKISHHGSKYSTSNKLLEIVECKNFLISTNGMRHCHPDKETFSKILKNKRIDDEVNLYFNYRIDDIFTDREKNKYKINCYVKTEFRLE